MPTCSAKVSAQLHRVALWNAILQAPFAPDFRAWWTVNILPQCPETVLPLVAPDQLTTHRVMAAFAQYVDVLDKELMQSRRRLASDRRQKNVNLIFRDIKAPGPEPVELWR